MARGRGNVRSLGNYARNPIPLATCGHWDTLTCRRRSRAERHGMSSCGGMM